MTSFVVPTNKRRRIQTDITYESHKKILLSARAPRSRYSALKCIADGTKCKLRLYVSTGIHTLMRCSPCACLFLGRTQRQLLICKGCDDGSFVLACGRVQIIVKYNTRDEGLDGGAEGG